MKKIGIFLGLAVSLVFTSCETEEECPDRNCSDFANQQAAQDAYNANPGCYDNLDRDNDGIACESL